MCVSSGLSDLVCYYAMGIIGFSSKATLSAPETENKKMPSVSTISNVHTPSPFESGIA